MLGSGEYLLYRFVTNSSVVLLALYGYPLASCCGYNVNTLIATSAQNPNSVSKCSHNVCDEMFKL
jgi:hypothetical protein